MFYDFESEFEELDPKAEMVIVRFASNPVASNAANDPTSLPAYHALAQHLLAHPR